jgi:hypothetical protein
VRLRHVAVVQLRHFAVVHKRLVAFGDAAVSLSFELQCPFFADGALARLLGHGLSLFPSAHVTPFGRPADDPPDESGARPRARALERLS